MRVSKKERYVCTRNNLIYGGGVRGGEMMGLGSGMVY